MIRIRFSDVDWTDVDGNVLKMSLVNDFLTNTRLSHNYMAPIVTEDSWNGKTFPVQRNIWESYLIEFYVKELAINMMTKMQSCSNISIKDLSTGEDIELDTKSSGALTLEPGDKFGTSGQSFNLICRSRKISTYPGMAVNNTNLLRIVSNTITYDFYSDREVISFITDSERAQYNNLSGIDYTAKTISKNGKRMIFYLMETQAVTLKRLIENVGYTSIRINPNTDNNLVSELGKCNLTLLSEGLYKCESEFIINTNLMYA